MSDQRTAIVATPCDRLCEPFHRTGYCVNCGMLAELHTPEGWNRYYSQQARACAASAAAAEDRATRMRLAEATNLARAQRAPTYAPQCRAGFWPSNGGTTGDSPICARCGRDKSDPVHDGRPGDPA